jgi:hypothetical protein
MNKHILVFIVVAMVGFAFNEAIVVTAQSNSTNSDRRNIIVTWLEINNTKTGNAPIINISSEDFWVAFGTLLKLSINGSINSSE